MDGRTEAIALPPTLMRVGNNAWTFKAGSSASTGVASRADRARFTDEASHARRIHVAGRSSRTPGASRTHGAREARVSRRTRRTLPANLTDHTCTTDDNRFISADADHDGPRDANLCSSNARVPSPDSNGTIVRLLSKWPRYSM